MQKIKGSSAITEEPFNNRTNKLNEQNNLSFIAHKDHHDNLLTIFFIGISAHFLTLDL